MKLRSSLSSPVVKKFRELSSKRKRKIKRNEATNKKISRRLYVGWKHKAENTSIYKVVTANKGGGQQQIDVEKTCSLHELEERVLSIYFPRGVSLANDLRLSSLSFFLATFNGELLPSDFTVESYYQRTRAYPIRIYLHTNHKDNTAISDEAELVPYTFTEGAMENNPGTNIEHDQNAAMSEEADLETCTSTESVTENSPVTSTECRSYEYQGTGTPTIQFRRRRLSLRRFQDDASRPSNLIDHGTNTFDNVTVEILDSEDEAIQIAIEESMIPVNDTQTEKTIEDVLREFKRAVDDDIVNKLLILRSRVLETAIKALERKVNLTGKLYIKFAGEMGEDYGGPRREFFRLVMQSLLTSQFFEGPAETEKIFSHNIELLEKQQYRIVGRLVALSLAQDGPGIRFLAKCLFDFMVGKEADVDNIDHLLPYDVKEVITKLEGADDFQKCDAFLAEHGDSLIEQGISNVYQMVNRDRQRLIKLLKKHHLFYRISAETSQFVEGMNDVNKAWEMVRLNAEKFEAIFCHQPMQLNSESLQRLFDVKYSDTGSNERPMEELTVYGWELFLQSIEDGDVDLTFQDVLSFITGADHVPPCGFPKLIDIEFYHNDGRLPHVSTCALHLWLPRVQDATQISEMLIRAIKESGGFLKV